MSNIESLMQLPGAMAAFRFTDKGELTESKIASDTPLTDAILDLLSHVCVANTAIATMQARGWEQLTGQKGFYPVNGFTMVGIDWTTVTRESTGVVLKNSDVDYQATYDALASVESAA